MIHQRKHPTLDIEDCFGCKISGVSFGAVPGGTKGMRIGYLNQRERDLIRYGNKRKAGEKPDGTTQKAMERSEKKQDLWDKRERDIRDHNSPDKVPTIRKALINQ